MVKQVIDVNFLTSLPQERFHVSQYDYGERIFEMHAYVGDKVWEIPAGSTVMLTGHKPSDPPTSFFVPCTFEGNVVTCDCKDTMTDVFGLVECELSVTTASGLIQSTNIILNVEKAPVQTGDIPASDYEAIQSMIAHSGQDVAQAAQYAELAVQQAQLAGEKAAAAAQSAAEAETVVDNKITEFDTNTVTPGLNARVKYTDISRATNQTATGQKAMDVVELNPSVSGSVADKLAKRVEMKAQGNAALTPAQLDALAGANQVIAAPSMKLTDSILPSMSSNGLYYKLNANYGGGIIFGDAGILLLRKVNGTYHHERVNTRAKSFNVSNIICSGFITSSSTNISFFIPCPVVAGGTVTLTSLNTIIRHALGGYPFIRSGTSGGTYTPLSSMISLWASGKAARTNEISGTPSVTVRDGIGIYVSINFVYAIAKASGNTAAITNNIPISVIATASGTVA